MSVFWDAFLALLAGAGLLAIGWLLFGRLVAPTRAAQRGSVCAVIRAEGSAPDLQQIADGLLWLNHSGLSAFRIVIADAGLNEEGRRNASALARRKPRVSVCRLAALGDCLFADTVQ